MTGDIISALRSYYLLGEGNKEPFPRMENMMFRRPAKILSRHLPGVFGFHPGAAADIAVLDYVPLSPIHESNLLGHLLFGAKGGRAFLTAVNGRILWIKGEFPEHSIQALRREAQRAARKLANRFQSR
jgi:cytosine/adenosine deaminase-related metal-dependent hydrolase